MSLTPSDVESLSASLSRWETAEYFFSALVVIGCFGELVADLASCLTEKRKKRVERWSTMLLVAALSMELICLVRANKLSDQVIGSLKEEAEEADKKAKSALSNSATAITQSGAAEEASGRARDKSDKADTSASSALVLANSARREADSLHQEVSRATGELTQLEADAQKTESDLVNLAICNAPRVIPLWSIGNVKNSIDPLKPFAGRQAIIEFMPDAEARRAAFNIYGALDKAGWKITRLAPVESINDGVEVQPFIGPADGSMRGARMRSGEAADAIVDFLHSYNWQASLGWLTDEKGKLIRDPSIVPADGLRIRVGLYPPVTFVAPPGANDLAAFIARFNQETEKSTKQIEQREEEHLKNLTPQEAIDFKAHREKWKQEDKLLMERYSGPCQPLTPLSPSLR